MNSTVDALRPSIREMGSYIATFQILAKEQGKSIQWRVDDEYVTDKIQYRLLESVVNDDLKKLMGD
ncbi:Cysteine protease [Phytophthora megakarya]|uniref:Cysteine protease n=1 Tax=Phytophthora megakarya TaxID=4795 RepID=A0A225VFC5_9STRA|nr:Cysteine protease [Phytophthora megakarya]